MFCQLFSSILFLSLLSETMTQNTQDVCISIPTQQPTPSVSLTGAPGKRGPEGLRGLKGDVGPSGPCVCDVNEQRRLQSEIDSLEDKLSVVVGYVAKGVKNIDFLCPVGLKDGRVQDADITSSGFWVNPRTPNDNSHSHIYARLDRQRGSNDQGVWAAKGPFSGAWIQVNLRTPKVITGVITQGRPYRASNPDPWNQWVTQLKVSYGDDGSNFTFIQDGSGSDKIFQGNHDRNSYKINLFPQPITAQYFRIIVVAWQNHPLLRMEFTTC